MPPDHMRIYAIGDIHGRADLLCQMHNAIAEHAAAADPADNHIVYLGDYIDRGLQVKEVIDILATAPPEEFTPVFLKGNHEEMLLEFLNGAGILEDWLAVGGRATLMSYGVMVTGQTHDPIRAEQIRLEFLDALPRNHHEFLSALQVSFRAGDYLFVHAGIRPGVPLENQYPGDLTSIREPFLSNRKNLDVRVIHGHNITSRPEILPWRIGVDTGAYATGRLSCVMIEGGQTSFLTVNADGNDDATP